MAQVFEMSEMLFLALHGMVLLASREPERLNVREIAEKTGASHAHLAKVLQRLSRAGLVQSVRGPKGGFSLQESR